MANNTPREKRRDAVLSNRSTMLSGITKCAQLFARETQITTSKTCTCLVNTNPVCVGLSRQRTTWSLSSRRNSCLDSQIIISQRTQISHPRRGGEGWNLLLCSSLQRGLGHSRAAQISHQVTGSPPWGSAVRRKLLRFAAQMTQPYASWR